MSRLYLSPYFDTTVNRQTVAKFLEKAWPENAQCASWEKRMSFWWEQNPAAQKISERGRMAYHDQELIGFGGLIPALHAWQGQPYPALYATTLCVDPRFPKAAAMLFLKQRVACDEYIITHSTPNQRVQQALLRMGALAHTQLTRHFFLAGGLARLSFTTGFPKLPPQLHLLTDVRDIRTLARAYQNPERLEKWITPEYLQWICQSPSQNYHFLGAADKNGILSSYLLITGRKIKGLKAWDVVEIFTTRDSQEEVHALLGVLIQQPDILPGGASLVTVATFQGDDSCDRLPAVLKRQQQVCHFFLLPKTLRGVPKHTITAEGDLGLS